MKLLGFLLALSMPFLLCAQGGPPATTPAPLIIATPIFIPPFVMQGAYNQVYGFDISMMQHICKLINRICQYVPMPFKEVLTTVAAKKADIGVGAIMITPDRSQIVNFSLPYLLSYSRFIAPISMAKNPLTVDSLNSSVIGFQTGTIFPQILKAMGVSNAQLVNYDSLESLIDALQKGKIDIGIMDQLSAIYWQTQSSGKLQALISLKTQSFGLGIAVNSQEPALLDEINQALLQYQNSLDFKRDYQKYIAYF